MSAGQAYTFMAEQFIALADTHRTNADGDDIHHVHPLPLHLPRRRTDCSGWHNEVYDGGTASSSHGVDGNMGGDGDGDGVDGNMGGGGVGEGGSVLSFTSLDVCSPSLGRVLDSVLASYATTHHVHAIFEMKGY